MVASGLAFTDWVPRRFPALSHEIVCGEERVETFSWSPVDGLYNRNDAELKAGKFSSGDADIFPAYANHPIRVEFWEMKWSRSAN